MKVDDKWLVDMKKEGGDKKLGEEMDEVEEEIGEIVEAVKEAVEAEEEVVE